MTKVPRLSVGLPVYNGANYLAESIEALLGQRFGDFELIISDNASNDETADICQRYSRQDDRIRYHRQPQNLGLAPNHNFVVDQARAELFKWASNDDLYARELLARCVAALDEHPDVVLAHSWTAMIDPAGTVTEAFRYPLATSAPRAADRFRSLLFDSGGDDDGGVIRTAVLRGIAPKGSYHHADRTTIAELALHGPFYQVPDWLYFRRDHPGRAEHVGATVRSRCAIYEPRRSSRLRNPVARLYAEYIAAYASMIHRAPLTPAERRECYRHLAGWMTSRAFRHGQGPRTPVGEPVPPELRVDRVVAGRT
jgi:glycosyltransferase involved in cell wall biosynthesis